MSNHAEPIFHPGRLELDATSRRLLIRVRGKDEENVGCLVVLPDDLDADGREAVAAFAFAVEQAPLRAELQKRYPNNPDRVKLELDEDRLAHHKAFATWRHQRP